MNDTSPEIPKKIFDKYMSLSGFERLQIGSSMFESAKKNAEYSLPKDLSELEKKFNLFLDSMGMNFRKRKRKKY